LETTNTDIYIFEKLCPSILEDGVEEENQYRSKGDWNKCMNVRFRRLAEANVTREEIVECFKNCRLTDPSIEYLKLLHLHNVPIHIVSDSNTLFISTILEASNASQYITTIHTNPHFFTGNELSIGQYHPHSTCALTTCPKNICKGTIVKDVLASLGAVPPLKIFVGDGSNDYCACTMLGDGDLIFARKGFPLVKKLQGANNVPKSLIIEWDRSEEILLFLQRFFLISGMLMR